MIDTKSVLLDIVQHTSGLGLEFIKVTGSADETSLSAIDPDKSVVMMAKMHEPIPDFVGAFGMGNLGLLSNLTKLSTYRTDTASVKVLRSTRNGVEVPTTLLFKDATSKDEYRFMSSEVVDQAMGNATMVGVSWDIDISPAKQKVSELAEVASIYMGLEPNFSVSVEDKNLIFTVGSASAGITGRRIFASNVDGALNSNWSWKLNQILNVLKLGMSGVCTMRLSNRGVAEITVDSGICTYRYLFPAVSQ